MYSDMLRQLSAYSKEPGESGGSAAWRGFNAGQVARPGGFYAGQAARNFVAILRQQESTMEQF